MLRGALATEDAKCGRSASKAVNAAQSMCRIARGAWQEMNWNIPRVARAPPRLCPQHSTRVGERPPDSCSITVAMFFSGSSGRHTPANCCRKPAPQYGLSERPTRPHSLESKLHLGLAVLKFSSCQLPEGLHKSDSNSFCCSINHDRAMKQSPEVVSALPHNLHRMLLRSAVACMLHAAGTGQDDL